MKTYTALQEELKSLRDSYKDAGEEDQKKMQERAEEIKSILFTHKSCYVCDIPVHEFSPKFPFCSDECHDKWKKEHPYENKTEGRILPIKYMQEKLLDFAADERKGNL